MKAELAPKVGCEPHVCRKCVGPLCLRRPVPGTSGFRSLRATGTRRVLLAAALAALALASACDGGDECRKGQVRCNGTAFEYCALAYSDGSAPLVWHSESCLPGVCVESKDPAAPTPFCARSAEPDPRCASGADFELCSGNEVIGCHQGLVEHTVNCNTGEDFGIGYRLSPSIVGSCVAESAWAICALGATPDPNCQPEAEHGVGCDGSTSLLCIHGYVTQRNPCPSGACSVAPAAYYTYCE